jgi:hypothetical protein
MPLTILKDVIRNCTLSDTTRTWAELKEYKNRDLPNALQRVKIEVLPSGTIWFCVDSKGSWSPYLSGTRGIHKRCDYVIVSHENNTTYIVFIELKSENVSNSDIRDKFKATECFIDYCESICCRLFSNLCLKKASKRFVVFAKGTEQKLPTRPETILHDQSDRPKLIVNPSHVKFKELIRQ